jgi:ABC-type multidrug transport system ATPase subunit
MWLWRAGKTTTINMLVGFTQPTQGTARVEGFDIRTDMDRIYTIMGVCPQHDILWETLTARQHMLFYGRLKNLSGDALKQVRVRARVRLHSMPTSRQRGIVV